MSQSKKASIMEAISGTVLGLCYAVPLQELICWAHNIPIGQRGIFWLSFWMTIASVVRTYILRRAYNAKVYLYPVKWWMQRKGAKVALVGGKLYYVGGVIDGKPFIDKRN